MLNEDKMLLYTDVTGDKCTFMKQSIVVLFFKDRRY